jgi:hypothetical protein
MKLILECKIFEINFFAKFLFSILHAIFLGLKGKAVDVNFRVNFFAKFLFSICNWQNVKAVDEINLRCKIFELISLQNFFFNFLPWAF